MEVSQSTFIPQGVLLDFDGTMVRGDFNFSPKLLSSIHSLQKYIPVALCTGRQYAMLAKVVFPLFSPSTLHVVAGGGQLVRGDGTVVWEQTISSERSRAIAQEVERLGGGYVFGQEDVLYSNLANQHTLLHHPLRPTIATTEHLYDWSTPLLSIVDITESVLTYVAHIPDVQVYKMKNSQGNHYFDITAPGINKTSSIHRWCDYYHIPPHTLAAVGDNFNDEEMLKMVGYPVVVRTAPPSLLQLAAAVIGTPQ